MKPAGGEQQHSGAAAAVDDVEAPLLLHSSSGRDGQAPRKKPLTLLPLIAIIFFEVSGGPFGTEVRRAVHACATAWT